MSLKTSEKVLSMMAYMLNGTTDNFIKHFDDNPEYLAPLNANPYLSAKSYNKKTRKDIERSADDANKQDARGTCDRDPTYRRVLVKDRLREKLAQKKLTLNIKDSDVK